MAGLLSGLRGPAAVRQAVLRLAKATALLADCVQAIDSRRHGAMVEALSPGIDVSQRLREAINQISLAVDEIGEDRDG